MKQNKLERKLNELGYTKTDLIGQEQGVIYTKTYHIKYTLYIELLNDIKPIIDTRLTTMNSFWVNQNQIDELQIAYNNLMSDKKEVERVLRGY